MSHVIGNVMKEITVATKDLLSRKVVPELILLPFCNFIMWLVCPVLKIFLNLFATHKIGLSGKERNGVRKMRLTWRESSTHPAVSTFWSFQLCFSRIHIHGQI